MEGYQTLERIGSGSFGEIHTVKRVSDGKIFARKEIDYKKMTDKEKQQLVAEVNILRDLKHPNIVRYHERFVDRESYIIYIIMEYCEGGDLSAIIRRCRKERQYIAEEMIWNILAQLLLALYECHSASGRQVGRPAILHRDIKPENVFLDGYKNVKLGDFGLSRIIEDPETEYAKTYVGTPYYMSPELVTDTCYNTKSDIWALGCLIYELCTLSPPFQAKNQPALFQKIQSGRVAPLPPQRFSSELQNVINDMLTVNVSVPMD
ncbi:kinase-like domain-containing protein [Polychytrium aggregatum]|uniref:kinase-like domain-containing protein n=1 Tax=Polychytrium aggregatum TaxID=110093 RepID=UPI0022FE11CF|nr:kinase-like domain-containing protein [Polychytrium aggregatum]KAI9207963.1 kinase-like domain-containing protein [Polychytrium aggregatum]